MERYPQPMPKVLSLEYLLISIKTGAFALTVQVFNKLIFLVYLGVSGGVVVPPNYDQVFVS